MYKSASPYIEELLKGGVKWMEYSQESINRAVKEDKIIFVHIGNISNINRRNKALELFNNEEVANLINENFIAVAIDTQEMEEAYLAGMDLLLINEQKISDFINIFSLPGGKPFTSFSSLSIEDFTTIAKNSINSFKNKREKLKEAANLLSERLALTGVVHKKEEPKEITERLLNSYIKSWSSRYTDKMARERRTPYAINPRNYVFALEYAHRCNIPEYLQEAGESLLHLYHSPMFDPIDGGVFSEAENYSFKTPHYDKSLYQNAKVMIAYILAYKYLKNKEFKEAAERVAAFIENKMKINERGYCTYLSLSHTPDKSTYYKYTLKDLKENFSEKRGFIIAKSLGMDTRIEENTPQIISNTVLWSNITAEEMEVLKQIRESRKGEIIADNRVITGYNCRVATAYCELSKLYKKGKREEYLRRSEEILENIIRIQNGEKPNLNKYITSKGIDNYISDLYDYSIFLNALLKQYLQTKETKWKNIAKVYISYIMENYYNASNGMFYITTLKKDNPPMKRAPVMDYNTINSNAIMAENLLILYGITKKEIYRDTFKQQMYNIEPQLIGSGPFMSGWGLQLVYYLTDKRLFSSEKE